MGGEVNLDAKTNTATATVNGKRLTYTNVKPDKAGRIKVNLRSFVNSVDSSMVISYSTGESYATAKVTQSIFAKGFKMLASMFMGKDALPSPTTTNTSSSAGQGGSLYGLASMQAVPVDVSGSSDGQGTGDTILSEVERFCREPITSTWDISDSAIEQWYLSHSNVKSKNAKYNLNAGNIREVTNAVRSAGVSPVLFYIYSVNEGSGGNLAGGFINHWTPKNVDTTDLPFSFAIQDANYLVNQSKKTDSSPATGGGEPNDMPTEAASAILKSLPAGSIGIAYIPSTSACTAEIEDLNGVKGDWSGLYGNPLQTLMKCIKELGGKL